VERGARQTTARLAGVLVVAAAAAAAAVVLADDWSEQKTPAADRRRREGRRRVWGALESHARRRTHGKRGEESEWQGASAAICVAAGQPARRDMTPNHTMRSWA
jgi:hypothetical protein